MIQDKTEDSFKRAKDYVYKLLKFRLRSEKEIIQRLKNKNFDEPIIKKTISYFKDLGLIDDLKFCQLWIEERIKKPFGFYRILRELKQRGIPQEIIDKVWQEKSSNLDEKELILKIIQKKLKDKSLSVSIKDKARLYSQLIRRGFNQEIVSEILDSL
jgi:regulatory protein